ncbi:MAG: hypothetical protein WC860_03530 [Candidatus Margulisiibacteriota bacterium]|jgi:hypothetical protein
MTLTNINAPATDMTTALTDTYNKAGQEFDKSVNKMIDDANATGVSSAKGDGSSNTGTTTVSTAALTTDGLVIQAKQSIRDTIGGAASTVMKTLQKLAQQLGQ